MDSDSYLVVDFSMLYQVILSEEDVTKVITTKVAELYATVFYESFNQDISSWDVSNVTDMSSMFRGAESFNQDLSSWDVSNVTDCAEFSDEATAWTEPKPNFTNCEE